MKFRDFSRRYIGMLTVYINVDMYFSPFNAVVKHIGWWLKDIGSCDRSRSIIHWMCMHLPHISHTSVKCSSTNTNEGTLCTVLLVQLVTSGTVISYYQNHWVAHGGDLFTRENGIISVDLGAMLGLSSSCTVKITALSFITWWIEQRPLPSYEIFLTFSPLACGSDESALDLYIFSLEKNLWIYGLSSNWRKRTMTQHSNSWPTLLWSFSHSLPSIAVYTATGRLQYCDRLGLAP